MTDVAVPELEQITKELYKKNLELVNANKEMALLQKLYEIMMETYDLEELSEAFIDTIVHDLGFASGLVAMKNPLGSHLQAIAVSRSREMSKSLELVGQPLATLQVSLHTHRNSLVTAFHLGRMLTVSHLDSILSPTIPKSIIEQIEAVIEVRSTMIFPIKFGEKKMGVFTISSKQPHKDISDGEQATLKRVSTLFGVALDRVLIYRALKEANAKLKMMDKRKDEFLNVAAHELRAPLTAVKGYISMILEGDAGSISEQVKHFMEGAFTGADREVRLVNNMLNMSRIEENRLVFSIAKVHLTEVVEKVFMEFKIQAEEKSLKIKTDIEKDVKDLVEVDPDRIHEVMANFVSNAVKYTDVGEVVVKVFNKVIDGDKWIRVEVSDSGFGMTADEQEKLFTKFYRAESSAGKVLGTGLGLYITKLLIDKFEGNLGIISEKGKGSTFWFELKVVR